MQGVGSGRIVLYCKAVVSMRMSALPHSGCKLNVRVDPTASFFYSMRVKKIEAKRMILLSRTCT